jgi:adenosylcobinamide-phosphate synthase
MALLTVLLAGLLDVAFGEPPNAIHPVAWLGRLIALLERGAPHERPRAEFAYGVVIVAVATAAAAGAGLGICLAMTHLPWWLALPLVGAGRYVQRALSGDSDSAAAREGLRALVSRDRDLSPSQVASAAIESLAENLSDSVVAPLLYFAVLGLPGALVYRAVNTLDAMVGYHGRYEYLGKPAARLDDLANLIPARLSGLLLVALACCRCRGAAAWAALRRQRRLSSSPNKLWTIAPMAGALGVRLAKPGAYAVGPDERPLGAAVIGEAAAIVWQAGAVTLAVTAALAALAAAALWR